MQENSVTSAAPTVVTLTRGNGLMDSYLDDAMGRVIQTQDPLLHSNYTVYDQLDPDSGNTVYTYDPGNRLISIANPFSETTTLAYDVLSRENSKTMANGAVTTRTWDAIGRDSLTEHRDGSGTLLSSFSTTYPVVVVAGQNRQKQIVTEINPSGTSSTVTYLHDCTYQLADEARTGTNPYHNIYEYDTVGNRTRKTADGVVTNSTYDAANPLTASTPAGTGRKSARFNRVRFNADRFNDSGQSAIAFTYDANGNLTSQTEDGQTTTNTWDDENRLASVATSGGGTESYTYSADGLRQSKTAAGVTTRFVWDEDNLLQETSASGTTQAQYTDYPGQWGGLTSMRRGGSSSFYHHDQSSNARVLTSSAAAVTDTYGFKGFGERLYATGSTVNPYRFGGEVGYFHDSDDRHYVRARNYSASTGRWMSEDPSGFGHGNWNAYCYAINSPLRWSDPSGLDHHIVPKALWARFAKHHPTLKKVFDSPAYRIKDDLYKMHNGKYLRGISAVKYNAAVEKELAHYLRQIGKRHITQLSETEAHVFAERISGITHGVIGTYNAGVRNELAQEVAAKTALRLAEAAASRRGGFISLEAVARGTGTILRFGVEIVAIMDVPIIVLLDQKATASGYIDQPRPER